MVTRWAPVVCRAAHKMHSIRSEALATPPYVEVDLNGEHWPAVTASMTNTVAMCPGYFGAVIAQRRDLEGQSGRLWRLLPLSLIGSLIGAWILLHTTERQFQTIVPYLLLFAAGLLALQGRLRDYINAHTGGRRPMLVAALPVAAAAAYGAYFGAGMGVILLAIISVVVDDKLIRTNAVGACSGRGSGRVLTF